MSLKWTDKKMERTANKILRDVFAVHPNVYHGRIKRAMIVMGWTVVTEQLESEIAAVNKIQAIHGFDLKSHSRKSELR